jgi:deazaflavin-dependent oxidoreductase (nitroreductase family)
MNPYERTMRAMSKTSAMRWLLITVLTPLDLKLRNTRFAPSQIGWDAPLCYLTTTGRSSGKPRTVPLLYVTIDGDDIAVVATNFGRPNHPSWAMNLEAHPKATLDVNGTSAEVAARRASTDEGMAIWSKFDRVWPGYEKYREISPRDIKVFVLTPS